MENSCSREAGIHGRDAPPAHEGTTRKKALWRRGGAWLIAPVRWACERLLERQPDSRFGAIFPLYNFLFLDWSISVDYLEDRSAFCVRDQSGKSVFLAHRERLKLYSKGIQARLDTLYREYHLDRVPLAKGDLVIDVGANIGEFSMIVQSSLANSICIEPEERDFECLLSNIDEAKSTCLNTALWSSAGNFTLYSANRSGDSSLFPTPDFTSARTIDTLTLKDVFDRHVGDARVRLLKLEAEGAEPEILAGGADVLNRIDFITVDVGPERGMEQSNTLVAVVHVLLSANFDLVCCGDKRLVLLFRNKKS